MSAPAKKPKYVDPRAVAASVLSSSPVANALCLMKWDEESGDDKVDKDTTLYSYVTDNFMGRVAEICRDLSDKSLKRHIVHFRFPDKNLQFNEDQLRCEVLAVIPPKLALFVRLDDLDRFHGTVPMGVGRAYVAHLPVETKMTFLEHSGEIYGLELEHSIGDPVSL